MPETPVNVDHRTQPGENDVGGARQVTDVQAKTKTKSMDARADDAFGRRVAALDRRHRLASLGWSEVVRHGAATAVLLDLDFQRQIGFDFD